MRVGAMHRQARGADLANPQAGLARAAQSG
jgi:hypothetical protein